ncbi:STAU1 [Cordylochernes scorpioides]|uniref:STAU1 n=1 Tax=Cordylochernes scorpioides TaxID=51811 RepID=A0ABY6JY49_9ARAC|nr:STAU1 [Cordylochernes scorpioides]
MVCSGLKTLPPGMAEPAAGQGPQAAGGTTTLANSKEKTPMCLVNELARYNKVTHQYHLVEESGLPHKKTFLVVLKLDKEEYSASGPSIKKAQHSAAQFALQSTTFKHPPPKSHRPHDPVTPTVELNALAMKRGEPAIYQMVDPHPTPYIAPNLNFRGIYNQRYHFPKVPSPFFVSLKVGARQFYGKGRTAKEARHCAAEEALRTLRDLPLPDHVRKRPEVKVNGDSGGGRAADDDDDSEDSDEVKSPISLVYEVALKRNFSVSFEMLRESGPPHMRTFITRCSVGDITTEGEGKGKKISKKRSAEKMLDELKKLSPLPPTVQKVKKKPIIKKKTRNLIKEQKPDLHFSQSINPISRLIQIQHAKKDREPIYTVTAERGESRMREFVIQCTLGDLSTTGTGPKKKMAKSNAAEAMLQLLGYSRPQAGKPPIKVMGGGGMEVGGVPAPCVGPVDRDCSLCLSGGVSVLNRAPGGGSQLPKPDINKLILSTAGTIARELLDSGVSPTAEAIRKAGHLPPLTPSLHRKQQLHYVAEVLGFQVKFTDFPKNNKLEHLSLVTLSTSPPHVKHGSGPTVEASHDQAALAALRSLAEMDPADGGKDC